MATVQEFAAKIKEKYPQYQGMDDIELTEKIVAKYPQYKSAVIMPAQSSISAAVSLGKGEGLSPGRITEKEKALIGRSTKDIMAESQQFDKPGNIFSRAVGRGVENIKEESAAITEREQNIEQRRAAGEFGALGGFIRQLGIETQKMFLPTAAFVGGAGEPVIEPVVETLTPPVKKVAEDAAETLRDINTVQDFLTKPLQNLITEQVGEENIQNLQDRMFEPIEVALEDPGFRADAENFFQSIRAAFVPADAALVGAGFEALRRTGFSKAIAATLKGTPEAAKTETIRIVREGVEGLSDQAKRTHAARTDRVVDNVDKAVAQILQGEPDDIARGTKALSTIDVDGIDTYKDLKVGTRNKVGLVAAEMDDYLSQFPDTKLLGDFERTATVGGRTASANHTKNALDNLEELYDDIDAIEDLTRIQALRDQAETTGLTVLEANRLSREYGINFKEKAFTKKGDPKTSVTAARFENTRKGVKNDVRDRLPDDTAKIFDKQMSDLINTEQLLKKMEIKVQNLVQKTKKRGVGAKLGRGTAILLEKLSFGSLPAFLQRLGVQSNLGRKTMNSLDMQNALKKNLKTLQKLEKTTDESKIGKFLDELLEEFGDTPSDFKKAGAAKSATLEVKGFSNVEELQGIFRSTKGMSADDIMKTHPDIQLKRDVPAKDIYGNKVEIPEGEVLTPYELKGNKILLQDGETYVVSKNQFQNIKGNSISSEAKEFAPELKGLEETVKGTADRKIMNAEEAKKFLSEANGRGEQVIIYGINDTGNAIKIFKKEEFDFFDKFTSDHLVPPTKYSDYQLPEGKNYKEILIKAPTEGGVLTKNSIKEVVQNPDGGWDVKIEDGRKFVYDDAATSTEARNEFDRDLRTGKIDVGATDKSVFRSSHWEEPNVISHLRMNERTYKGKKVAFMEEVQSDWAREGRNKGFQKDVSAEKAEAELILKKYGEEIEGASGEYYRRLDEAIDRMDVDYKNKDYERIAELSKTIYDETKDFGGVPSHPLVKGNKWQEPSVKRALKEAVDSNADYFAWINGEQTSARYNLTTQLDNVKWKAADRGGKDVTLRLAEGGNPKQFFLDESGVIRSSDIPSFRDKPLNEALGKGLADSIMSKPKGTLSGEGLKFGGEWASNLYDKQVANIVKKLTGGKIEKLDMGLPIEKTKSYNIANDRMVTKTVVTPKNAKVGMEIAGASRDRYIITEVLKDGKVKAVPKSSEVAKKIESGRKAMEERIANGVGSRAKEEALFKRLFPEDIAEWEETFDISVQKTTQQGIKLTPEIKAKIRGEALNLKANQ